MIRVLAIQLQTSSVYVEYELRVLRRLLAALERRAKLVQNRLISAKCKFRLITAIRRQIREKRALIQETRHDLRPLCKRYLTKLFRRPRIALQRELMHLEPSRPSARRQGADGDEADTLASTPEFASFME